MVAREKAREITSPHPEERRFLAARLEGWPLAQQCLLPSFETPCCARLLRMRPSFSPLHIPHFRIHPHVLAAALGEFLAGDEIVAPRGALRCGVEVSRPFAERITEPGLLRLELGQPQLLPDFPRVLHVFTLGQ